ncbi:MAG: FkbM family methyltransferase, partial [Symploca sp. SIO2E6]|nr:FkbM family methyltransferase [Symploca sp. SIO2E6]
AGSKGSNLAVADFLKARGYQLFRYQPYLQKLIPIDLTKDLSNQLNIIAVPADLSN